MVGGDFPFNAEVMANERDVRRRNLEGASAHDFGQLLKVENADIGALRSRVNANSKATAAAFCSDLAPVNVLISASAAGSSTWTDFCWGRFIFITSPSVNGKLPRCVLQGLSIGFFSPILSNHAQRDGTYSNMWQRSGGRKGRRLCAILRDDAPLILARQGRTLRSASRRAPWRPAALAPNAPRWPSGAGAASALDYRPT